MPLPLPGGATKRSDRARGRSTARSSGRAFFVGEAEAGPVGPNRVTSLEEFTNLGGTRQSYSPLYDAVETFFREGGSELYWSRVVAPTATTAFIVLNDNAAAAALRVEAAGPGEYANGWRAWIRTNVDDANIPAGFFSVRVTDAAGTILEESPAFDTKLEHIGYANANWKKARLIDQASALDPVRNVGGTALAGGAANRNAITQVEKDAAIDRFPRLLGAGQIALPGDTTTATHRKLLSHAAARNRHALLDLPDTAVVATLTAAVRAADVDVDADGLPTGRRGEPLWPWALIPGLTPYTFRTVPYSAVQAGVQARVDGQGNPNEPARGEDPLKAPRFAVGLSQANPSDADRTTLNDQGVNVAMVLPSGVVQMGNRTLRTQGADPNWLQASGSRMMMVLEDEVDAILARFVHEQNQKGVLSGQLNGEVVSALGVHFDKGALYGNSPQDAFAVDTGPNVNTDASIGQGFLRVALAARVTPGADRVEATITRVATTEAVA